MTALDSAIREAGIARPPGDAVTIGLFSMGCSLLQR